MTILDDVQGVFDQGFSVAKGAVSSVAGEQVGFVRGFARMCSLGFAAGYHERNGGNASYRLTSSDLKSVRSFFYDSPSSWVPLGIAAPSMAGEYLLVTGSGIHLGNVLSDPLRNTGIVEIDASGEACRVVWGLKGGSRPTSEIAAHVEAHAVRKEATNGRSRVMYHAHPSALVALTALVPADSRTMTRLLWFSLTESVIAIPRGVGMLPWMVPGSPELAHATAEALRPCDACVWQLHGVFASGDGFDEAFGLVSAIDKAADVYLRARAAHGGSPNLPYSLSDADIRAIAAAYRLPVNEDFLD